MYFIKELEKEQRPRERLIINGSRSLSNIELLAILLQTGTKTQSVLELSAKVLQKIDTIYNLNKVTVAELTQIKGIKNAKATTIIAAIELGRRLENKQIDNHKLVDHLDVFNLMNPIMKHLSQEHLYVILLNTKGVVIDKKCVYIGSINQTIVHPREIFNEAIKQMAFAIIIVHNHPTGDSKASEADFKTTEELIKAAAIIGILIADHIIIGNNEYYSIKLKRKFIVNKRLNK